MTENDFDILTSINPQTKIIESYLNAYQLVMLCSQLNKNSKGEAHSPSSPCFLPKMNPKTWAQNNKNCII